MLSFSLFSGYSAAELENWGSDRLAVLVGAYLSYVTGVDGGRAYHVRQLVHAEVGGERVLDGIPCRVFDRVCRGSGCEGSLGEGGGDVSCCAPGVPVSEAGSGQGKTVHGGSVCGLDVRVSGSVVVEERESVACHGDGSGAGLPGSDSASDGVEGNCAARGKNYESNKKKREQRKRRAKVARMAGDWRSVGSCKSEPDSEVGVDQNVPTLAEYVSAKIDEEFFDSRALEVEMKVAERVAMQRAKKTLADKWAVENELAAARAKRSLEILMAQDVQAEIKRQSTYLKLQTEKNMVGMEKAHQFLKRTGNVPGFAQTVLSDEGLTDGSSASPASPGECTISPDSSASMKEFREVVKQKADLEEKLARICKMTKVSLEDLDDYDKNTWSLKSENYEKLDRMYPGGYILDPVPDYENYDPPTHGYLKF